MEYNFGTLDLGTYFFRPARVKHGHFTTMEGGATWLLRSDGELLNWYTQNEWVRWGGEAVNYGPDGSRMRWSQSTHDLGRGPSWRSDSDLQDLVASAQWQRDQGNVDPGYVAHGQGTDHSLVAIAKAIDAANLQGGHGGHDHSHEDGHDHVHVPGEDGHVHYGAVDPAQLPGTDWGRDPAAARAPGRAHRRELAQLGRRPRLDAGRPVPRADPVVAAGAQPEPWTVGRRRDVSRAQRGSSSRP